MGKTLFELAKQAQPDYPHQIILAKVDGKLHELKDMEIENEKVEYITTAAAVGNETYRRSVVLLMLHAIYLFLLLSQIASPIDFLLNSTPLPATFYLLVLIPVSE